MRNKKRVRVLHVVSLDKFIPGFIDIVRRNFQDDQHVFLVLGNYDDYPYVQGDDTIHYSKPSSYLLRFIYESNFADVVILHGLFRWRLAQIITFMPWLYGKVRWVIWGGDLYFHLFGKKERFYVKAEKYRKKLISNLGALVTYVDGDYHRAVEWYGAKGKLIECIMYTSNVFHQDALISGNNSNAGITVLAGNSADPSNNHMDMFDRIASAGLCHSLDRIYCPLSYGDKEYALEVELYGNKLFGDKFIPLKNFIPIEKYKDILKSVDVAVFNHERQQAMGNTINLLGLGKKVFIRTNTSTWDFIEKLGVKVFDIEQLELSHLGNDAATENNMKIVNYFNENNLLAQLNNVFKKQL